ncbi:hypothetical protein G6F60_011056 [Rhizopus arrhizus]|nr:hypothetical protein G6F23_008058 [Rhizopus arrhizus]KAG0764212.1 hypothetical protein G6F24_005390 [Rhizopus arrhizus]KAG0949052.1 hypothetical protein G6F32_005632 [Rhizopus arrhizus]KAG1379210.1 hypothetical protein G6F61_005145 [Rhizopus arrhizus]KAG1394138.1 hypothetical protein G6F60_011056 [Rhizopus arrhizus]
MSNPVSKKDSQRIQSTQEKNNRDTGKNSFAARAQRAADKNTNADQARQGSNNDNNNKDITHLIFSLQDQVKQLRIENLHLKEQIESKKEIQTVLTNENKRLNKEFKELWDENYKLREENTIFEARLMLQKGQLSSSITDYKELEDIRLDLKSTMDLKAEQYEQDRITWNETEAELQKELQLLQKMSRVSSNNILASNKTEPNTKSTTDENQMVKTTLEPQSRTRIELDYEYSMIQEDIGQARIQSQANNTLLKHMEQEMDSITSSNQSLVKENQKYLHLLTFQGDQQGSHHSRGMCKLSCEEDDELKKAAEMIETLQEANHELQLYIQKVLKRIMNDQRLQDVLNVNYEPIINTSTTTTTSTKTTVTSNWMDMIRSIGKSYHII